MTDPDQWRFQWPDGTWIRWNPHTQAWEKEPAGAEAVADVEEPVAVEPQAAVETTPPVVEELATEPVTIEEAPVEEEEERESLSDETPADDVEVPYEVPRSQTRRGRGRRSMVGDVLPPQPEPERPGGSLWPTVLTGIVVGLGVGLLVWSIIR